ncbi:MAG TPA: hypothetical protein VGN97_22010 [Mesorhizobium sp.]|jgi:hypothetical protein|nr:hypothetical protein [Mesorhizobium sp.]
MPLKQAVRDQVIQYCNAHLPPSADVATMFGFIEDAKLRDQIGTEFQAARYIYKLGEALAADELQLHSHVKFQVVQYASIYEAVIVHLLWTKFAEHAAVVAIEFHKGFRRVASLPTTLQLNTTDGEPVHLCAETLQRTPRVSIKFDDKVDAAVKIGFLDDVIGAEIKGFYKLRNAIHLESAVKNEAKYELATSQLAFLRMQPFTRGIKDFLATGQLSEAAKPKQAAQSADLAVIAETGPAVASAGTEAQP